MFVCMFAIWFFYTIKSTIRSQKVDYINFGCQCNSFILYVQSLLFIYMFPIWFIWNIQLRKNELRNTSALTLNLESFNLIIMIFSSCMWYHKKTKIIAKLNWTDLIKSKVKVIQHKKKWPDSITWDTFRFNDIIK